MTRTHVLTDPSIETAQNRPNAQLRLAAQARLYSDVKRDQTVRLGAAAAIGVVAALLSVLHQGKAIGVIAGIFLLFVNGLLMYRERRHTSLAVATQEDFGNDVLLRRRPTGQEIAAAAHRFACVCCATTSLDSNVELGAFGGRASEYGLPQAGLSSMNYKRSSLSLCATSSTACTVVRPRLGSPPRTECRRVRTTSSVF